MKPTTVACEKSSFKRVGILIGVTSSDQVLDASLTENTLNSIDTEPNWSMIIRRSSDTALAEYYAERSPKMMFLIH